MAKSKAYQETQQAARAIKKQEMQVARQQQEEPETKKRSTRNQLGEIVSAVGRDNTVYEVYDNRGNKVAERTGARILEKMTYNNNLKKWVSKAKGNKYVIRRKR